MWAMLSAGCATTSSSQFTSAEELKKLTSGPKPQQVFTRKSADVSLWTFLGPFPTEVSLAPHEQESPAGKMIVAEASKRGTSTTAALACAARELAHFIVEKQEQPPLMLQEAIAGRCAVGTAQLAWNWLQMTPGDETEKELVALATPKLSKELEALNQRTFAGAAFSRSGNKAVLALVHTEMQGTLEPVSLFPGADGSVTLHGTADAMTAELGAVVTLGDLGATACVDLHLRPLPQYDLRCPVEATDTSAWISVATRAKGRLLSQELRRVLVWPIATTLYPHPFATSFREERGTVALLHLAASPKSTQPHTRRETQEEARIEKPTTQVMMAKTVSAMPTPFIHLCEPPVPRASSRMLTTALPTMMSG